MTLQHHSSVDPSKDSGDQMHVDPSRAKQLSEACAAVSKRITAAAKDERNVRLICVSKLKPATDILALHRASPLQSHFGENYAQELQEKAALLPRTVKWHMIGALQTNKCRPLAERVPNLWCVSSVDSLKKANALEKGRGVLAEHAEGERAEPLRVRVQVNTSGESSKSGVEPGDDVVALCRHIRDECPHLQLDGLMTIGAIARSHAASEETANEDFVALRRVRDDVARELGMRQEELQLSMGMSADFEAAIVAGSDEVRVGTTIFGQRPAKADAKVKEDVESGED